MKKYAVYAVVGIVLIVLLVALGRSCKIIDKYSRLEGQYQEALRVAKAHADILNQAIIDKDKIIGEKDAKIRESGKAVSHLESDIGGKNRELDALDKKLAAATTDSERVPILQAQVEAWSSKFYIAQNIIVEKDKVIGAWTAKYDAQVSISESWKARYEDEARLHAISRSEISALNMRLRTSRITGNLKTGLVIAAGAYLSYQAIKG